MDSSTKEVVLKNLYKAFAAQTDISARPALTHPLNEDTDVIINNFARSPMIPQNPLPVDEDCIIIDHFFRPKPKTNGNPIECNVSIKMEEDEDDDCILEYISPPNSSSKPEEMEDLLAIMKREIAVEEDIENLSSFQFEPDYGLSDDDVTKASTNERDLGKDSEVKIEPEATNVNNITSIPPPLTKMDQLSPLPEPNRIVAACIALGYRRTVSVEKIEGEVIVALRNHRKIYKTDEFLMSDREWTKLREKMGILIHTIQEKKLGNCSLSDSEVSNLVVTITKTGPEIRRYGKMHGMNLLDNFIKLTNSVMYSLSNKQYLIDKAIEEIQSLN